MGQPISPLCCPHANTNRKPYALDYTNTSAGRHDSNPNANGDQYAFYAVSLSAAIVRVT
ncbi:MAG: hypothetical protein IPG51_17545 [Chloroflexi bacterium]|nr:hypothetical protein [Chloroflexota bacterium]